MPKAGVITIDIDAGTAKFLADMDKSNAKLQEFGQKGQQSGIHVVSSMQAASAAIRLMEGDITHNVRAVERLVSMFPQLSSAITAAFPLVAGAAFLGLLGSMTVKAVEFFQKMADAPRKMAEAFNGLNQPLKLANDELALANDRLTNEIAKLAGKPQNGLATSLDEARVMADKLADSLDKDLERIQKIMTENKTPWWQIFTPGTSGADKRAQGLRTQVAQDASNPGAQLQDFQNELKNVQADLVKALAANAPKSQSGINEGGLPGGGASAEVSRLKEYAAQYQGEIDRINATLKEGKLTQQKTLEETGKENAAKAKEAARAVTQALKEGDEDQLAQLRSTHEVSVDELINYWQRRLAVEHGNADRVREINRTLGTLYQEQGHQIEAAQNQIQEYAVRIYAANQRIQESNQETANSFAKAADSLEKFHDEAAKTEDDKLAKTPLSARLNPSTQIGLGGLNVDFPAINRPGQTTSSVSAGLASGVQNVNTRASDLSSDLRRLQYAQQINAPLADQLALKEKILAQAIALAEAEGQNSQQLQAQLATAQALSQVQQWKNIGVGTAQADVLHAALELPQAIGQALASIVFPSGKHHESAGRRVGQAAEGVGKSLVGQIATQAIERLIATIIPQIAIGTAQVTAMAANTAADIALTAAIVALTTAVGIESATNLIPFADGGDPPVGHASLIGERGPELFVPKTAGTIIPNHKIGGYLSDGVTRQAGAIFPRASSSIANIPGPSSGSSSSFASSVGDMHFHAHGMANPDDFIDYVAKKLPGRLKSTSPVFGPASV